MISVQSRKSFIKRINLKIALVGPLLTAVVSPLLAAPFLFKNDSGDHQLQLLLPLHLIHTTMSTLLDQAIAYAQENPGVVAGACLAVLVIGVTQIVITTSVPRGGSGVLTEQYAPYPLVDKTIVSHNTRIFRFALPSDSATLGLPLGRHISLRATVDGSDVRRPYTPISSDSEQGTFELCIKVYPEPHGTMSRHLDSLRLGETIDVRGPLGKFTYARNSYRKLNMVCGGTGITPMWQVFRAILDDPSDRTEVSLVFANVTADDILLKEQLDDFANTEDRFSVYYVLNNPPEGWTGGIGFVSQQMLEERFGKAESDYFALMCGPPPMNKAMKNILANLGYTDSQVFKF